MHQTLTIVSKDSDLVTQCLTILREMGAADWKFVVHPTPPERIEGRICLWDCEPEDYAPLTEGGDPTVRHYFLVRSSCLSPFLEAHPWAKGNILLKPVSRTVMTAHLSWIIRPDNELNSLRADRDEILQELLHANLRLQEFDRQRTRFLARIAHDFRSPLTALSGFCGLLVDEKLGELNELQKEALTRAQHSVNRLTRMTNSIFQYSIAGERDTPPRFERHDICQTIEQAVQEMIPQSMEKNLKLSIDSLVRPAVEMYFERSQIEQVLINLLDNACKATPRHGSIKVAGYPYFWERRFLAGGAGDRPDRRASRAMLPNSYRVDVQDSGPGIPEDKIEDLFQEYTSFFDGQDRSGGGLGLAISRMIVHRHKGHIWTTPTPKGALFSFVLPFGLSADKSMD